jgi:hypothetical protein
MSKPAIAAQAPNPCLPSSGGTAPLPPVSVDASPISGQVPVDTHVAALKAEIVDLKDRLRCAEREIGRLRAAAPAPLVMLPTDASRAAAVPLRFSSIPPALRTSGRKKALKVAVTLGLLLLVAGFVALSVMSRSHGI